MPLPGPHELLLVGVSHRTTPVELRELCAVGPEAAPGVLKELKDGALVHESWLLSTCNRTEALVVAADPEPAVAAVRARVFARLESEPRATVYVHQGVDALFHVFSVAAGLNSQVLGESQILAQMKAATEVAQAAGTVGPDLVSVLQQALAVGRRIRRDTSVGEGTLSVAKAGVELAQKVLGNFRSATALVVGAGETGLLVARNLAAEGIRKIVFMNRTLARAEAAAAEIGGEARPLDELAAALSAADLTVVSVDTHEPLIRPEHLDRAALRRRDAPAVLIDLSVPRAVDPALKEEPDLLLHDLDDLDAIVDRHHRERQAEIAAASRIVVAEVHKYLALRTYHRFKPVITSLHESFESIRSEMVAGMGGADARVDEISVKLTRRLLDAALSHMKQGTRLTQSEDALERSYQRYRERS